MTSAPRADRTQPQAKANAGGTFRLGPVVRNLRVARRLERRPAQQVQAVQSRLLVKLLRHAQAAVPYYRRVLDPAAVAQVACARDLSRLPTLDRADLHDSSPEDLLADGFTVDNTKPATTSGSSGIPITVRNSERDLAYLRAVYLNDLLASGLRPWDRIAYCRVNPFLHHRLERFGILPSARIDVSQGLDEQVDTFLRARPTFMAGFPHVIHGLVEELQRRGVPYRGLRTIVFGGDRLAPAARSQIAGYFGARLHELYATVETFTIARTCPRGALHLRSADVVVEVERDDGTVSVEEGEGEALVTRLRSEAMPLIRYRVGDRIRVEPNDCGCGVMRTPIVREIQGRAEDRILTPDGRAISGNFVMFAVQAFPEVRRLQIAQPRPGALEVRVVTGPGPRPGLAHEIRAAVEQVVPGWSVAVQPVDHIAPEANGKIKFVKVG